MEKGYPLGQVSYEEINYQTTPPPQKKPRVKPSGL